MSTSPQSCDEYKEEGDSSRGRVNTDNNIDNNLTNLDEEEDIVDTDQLLSHAIIETIQYEDFVKQQENGVEIVKIEEEEENDENIEVFELDDEEEDEDIFPQVKRYRTTTELSDTQQKVQQQVITVTLQCPQVDCLEMMATDEFNDHMLKQHSIGPHRCLVKDCAQSFNHKHTLSEHIKQSHKSTTTELHCDKCPRHYPSYNLLSQHNIQNHQFGYFQCAFPLCPFAGELRRKVHDHYRHHHKTHTMLKCDHPAGGGCQYQTRIASQLKHHQLAHLGLKPYKCSWPQCDFAATQRNNTIRHIRSIHLKDDQSSNGTVQLDVPKDYVEVLRELL